MVIQKLKILDLNHHLDIIPILAAWHQAEWPHLERDRIQMIKERTSAAFLPKTFIASIGKQPLGLASLVDKVGEERTPWLSCLLVVPEARGKGVGQSLLEYCGNYVSSLGYKELYLHTSERRYVEPDEQTGNQDVGMVPDGRYWVSEILVGRSNDLPSVFRLPRGGFHATSFSCC